MLPRLSSLALSRFISAPNLEATAEPAESSLIDAIFEPVDKRLRDFCRAEVESPRILAAVEEPIFVLIIIQINRVGS